MNLNAGVAAAAAAIVRRCRTSQAYVSMNFAKGVRTADAAAAEAAQGHYREAAELYRKALPLFKGHTGTIPASIMRELGTCLVNCGDNGAALPLLQRSLEMARAFPDEHLVNAKCEDALANILARLGRPTEALDSAERSLALFERIGYSPGIIEALTEVACLYSATGQKQRALESLRRAETLCSSSAPGVIERKGLVSHRHANVEMSIAGVLCDMRNFVEARRYAQSYLDRIIRHYGRHSETAAVGLRSLADVDCRLENTAAAMES